ncbi:PfkB family carbohydrate kinase [Sinanaerobacter chloroacetimidivorans]|jgi:sugar/nucleoside kinase (ribokinase family)|uniref:Ribokinase n=1 Tax=Sinanaerobacter chloroacetimidivorans TaxID=2818044 RepID=A0A8J8B3W6_9FIRM|nr:PfkB family carbohydrate kinase [Sinanaerobacter chloroacetimidivorans]MBR0600191.1 ribokinase [Sinanaerobacter chloroacetimidivorans]
MSKKQYDTLVIGPVSLDHNIDFEGREYSEVGGAIVQSGFAAARTGHSTALFTKLNPEDADLQITFESSGADIYWKESEKTTSIRNKYFTADKETRECRAISICDSFTLEEIPDLDTRIYHLAGLIYGDFSSEMIRQLSERDKKVAVDVQCLLRHAEPDGGMVFYDWPDKKTHLKYIDFLKTDAAEAEILTGKADRTEAAKILHSWGAKEIMITHNTEVLIYDGRDTNVCPIRARNLSGRTGRGDTCFSGYITERLTKNISEALLFAVALVSLKMEQIGPFKGDRNDVDEYIRDFYPEYIV